MCPEASTAHCVWPPAGTKTSRKFIVDEAVKGLVTDHGLSGLLAGIIILLSVNALIHVTKFLYELARKSNELTAVKVENLITSIEKLTKSLEDLRLTVGALEKNFAEDAFTIARLKIDNRRVFVALRWLAGDDSNWEALLKRMGAEQDFT